MFFSKYKFDNILFVSVLCLLLFGIIMIASIGVPKSLQLSASELLYANCSSEGSDCYLLLKQHIIRVIIGFVAFILFSCINYKFWKKISFLFFIFSFVLLLLVFFIGDRNNTFAQSWINIPLPFLNSIQPSEIAKIGLIIYLAYWMEVKQEKIASFKEGFFPFCIISLLIIGPIILQPDLGSTLVISAVATAIYFVAGAKIQHILFGAMIAFLVSTLLIGQADYLNKRIKAYLYQDTECFEDYCWQSEQAKIAVGSGGFWGRGLTQGIQKSYWLPQASDDFIFAASAEELGFIRIVFLILIYLLIAYRGFFIANHAPNRFSMLLATGITTWIVVQAFINISVNISLLPITGITLPFISYGGSSLVTSLIGAGILLNISKHVTANTMYNYGRRNRWTRAPKYSSYRRIA